MIATYALAALLPLASAMWTEYKISPRAFPEMCLKPNSTENGAGLVLAKCTDTTTFKYSDVNGKLKVETACIDIRDGDKKNGTIAQTWDCAKCNKHQTFDFVSPNNDTDYHIKWTYADYCLDLIDGKGEEGSQVQIWGCLEYNDNQKWNVAPVKHDDAASTDEAATQETEQPVERSIKELSAHARRMHARRSRHH